MLADEIKQLADTSMFTAADIEKVWESTWKHMWPLLRTGAEQAAFSEKDETALVELIGKQSAFLADIMQDARSLTAEQLASLEAETTVSDQSTQTEVNKAVLHMLRSLPVPLAMSLAFLGSNIPEAYMKLLATQPLGQKLATAWTTGVLFGIILTRQKEKDKAEVDSLEKMLKL